MVPRNISFRLINHRLKSASATLYWQFWNALRLFTWFHCQFIVLIDCKRWKVPGIITAWPSVLLMELVIFPLVGTRDTLPDRLPCLETKYYWQLLWSIAQLVGRNLPESKNQLNKTTLRLKWFWQIGQCFFFTMWPFATVSSFKCSDNAIYYLRLSGMIKLADVAGTDVPNANTENLWWMQLNTELNVLQILLWWNCGTICRKTENFWCSELSCKNNKLYVFELFLNFLLA